MNILEELRRVGAIQGKTRMSVVFLDGTKMEGVFWDYTYAEDNEEEVASIDLKIDHEEVSRWLREDEIKSIRVM